MPDCEGDRKIDRIRSRLREHISSLLGEEKTAGLEIAAMVRIISNLMEGAEIHRYGKAGLSGPRLGLLFRLIDEEHHGNLDGITPTSLSNNQNVSRNTISVLLRGLEEQGLIVRALDSQDKRIFRIRLSDAGRKLITSNGPGYLTYANKLAAGLSPDEQAQLLDLLSKLYCSIVSNSGFKPGENAHQATFSPEITLKR